MGIIWVAWHDKAAVWWKPLDRFNVLRHDVVAYGALAFFMYHVACISFVGFCLLVLYFSWRTLKLPVSRSALGQSLRVHKTMNINYEKRGCCARCWPLLHDRRHIYLLVFCELYLSTPIRSVIFLRIILSAFAFCAKSKTALYFTYVHIYMYRDRVPERYVALNVYFIYLCMSRREPCSEVRYLRFWYTSR